jgi:DNA-directed RNA polymerase specialized sigma subunit, sigma24 homolog
MYGGAAYALALRIVRDRELSADVVQDAFLTVWRQASKFDPRVANPRAGY